MTDQNEADILRANRHKKMPHCSWRCLGIVRGVIRADGSPYLEMLYEDGWGKPFWGPLPIFHEPTTPEPEVKGWRRFMPKAFR